MLLPPTEALDSLDAGTLADVRTRFQELGFRPEVLGAAESTAPGQLDAVSLPLVRWALRQRGDGGAWLARLFSYGETLSGSAARAHLGTTLLATLCRAGLLTESSEGVRCPYRLVPLEGLYIVGDEPSAGGEAVMGPGPTTLELLDQLPLRCESSVLDVGTGAGTLALVLASRGAPKVIATDLSQRATTLARFNARLNGLNLDVRTGDLVEPVRGERFGWVVSQPSYVFRAPGSAEVTFLHGGPRGDELAFRLLAQIPPLLADEGTALVLFDTPTQASPPLATSVRAAVGDELDLLLLAAPGPSANAQAVAYAALEDSTLGLRYAEAVERNRDYLQRNGLLEWTHLLCVLRKTRRRHGGFTAQLPVSFLRQGGPGALVTVLSGIEVATLPDEELLSASLSVHPGVPIGGQFHVQSGSWGAAARQGRGAFASTCRLSSEDLDLLVGLCISPSVREALDRCAPEDSRAGRLARIRELASRGIVVPSAHPERV